eukprot:scaffold6834_cov83-Cylindrotheca_fusiformis.AAC.1
MVSQKYRVLVLFPVRAVICKNLSAAGIESEVLFVKVQQKEFMLKIVFILLCRIRSVVGDIVSCR